MEKIQIPPIKQLRTITQQVKSYRTEWQYVIHRKVSVYLTWLLLHTSITPNQITILSLLLGFLGASIMLFASDMWILVAFVCFYGYFLLDKVDGEIARFKNKESLRGIFLDYIGHMLIPPLVPLTIGGHLAQQLNSSQFWLVGAVAALACLLMRSVTSIPITMILEKYQQQSTVFNRLLVNPNKKESENMPPTSGRKLWYLIIKCLNTTTFSGYFGTTLVLIALLHTMYLIYNPFTYFFAIAFSLICLCQIIIVVIVMFDFALNIEKDIFLILKQMENIPSNNNCNTNTEKEKAETG